MANPDPAPQSYELRDPDVRLMLAVRDGSAAAFEELVQRYQNRLVTILEHMIGDRDDAEDLAQEVFLRVFRSRKTYLPGAKFSTWLYTIANNVACNHLRRGSARHEHNLIGRESGPLGIRPLENLAPALSGQMPTRQVDRAELQQIVRAAIGNLGEGQRLALLLHRFEDMSYADIAETMNLSVQAVKSLLCRARVRLREILQPYLEEGSRPAET